MKFLFLICFTAIALSNAFTVDPIVGLGGRLCARIYVEPENMELIRDMQFPDTPDTHEFLRCTFESIELWDDETGFQVNMMDELLKDHDLAQEIKDEFQRCAREARQENVAKWVYDTFACVLNGALSDVITDIIRRIQLEIEDVD